MKIEYGANYAGFWSDGHIYLKVIHLYLQKKFLKHHCIFSKFQVHSSSLRLSRFPTPLIPRCPSHSNLGKQKIKVIVVSVFLFHIHHTFHTVIAHSSPFLYYFLFSNTVNGSPDEA